MADRRDIDRLRGTREEMAKLHDDLTGLLGGSEEGPALIKADELAKVDQALRALDHAMHRALAGSRGHAAPALPSRGTRPVRGLVLDALDDLRWPAYAREISLYRAARYGSEIPLNRFGTLGSDEMKAFDRGSRPRTVWLCFCLTYNRAEPIKRLLARSDWSLAQRVAAPTTGRVQHLKITARLCEIALEAGDTADNPEMLKIVAADHARDLVGITFRRGEFPLELWRETAIKLLSEVEPRDEELRHKAAERIASLSERYQLFGVPDVIAGPDTDAKSFRVFG
jgi:hypothetical protein